ncbi:MAG TPA: hypothetical protein VK923_17940 [Euzebyales bacterium]|nr:hypothetical protein [Euzebyales bacterium]
MRVIPVSLAMRFALSLLPDAKHAPLPGDARKPNAWYRETLTDLLGLRLQARSRRSWRSASR